ncbi:ABC transporter ATP-binding protein [Fretibacterium sp. OH1220_COT-178]|uniref:ABC transporter ATP-binding protein n=1 Tax=Fretibacterium sp. OH1220_COT-178 TaxID=2491047 RepID=UPI000F5D5C30|nr:ABC transporter ATP-binding protein [Fretibacterium sp. OH1220_COT-178]RRD63817.1 ABC transporter ATP-binding protein [Fretibacterium sp. OH1220_COT-178]
MPTQEKTTPSRPGAVRRLAAHTAPYRYRLAGAVFFMLASSGLNILPPWLFKSVVDDVLISKNLFALNLICVSVVLIFVLKAMTLYGQQYLMNDVGQRVVMDIRIVLYDHMQRMSLRTLHAARVGELMSRITGDVATLQNLVTNTFVDLVFNAVTFVGMFSFILYLNWRLTLLIVVVLPVVAWLLAFAARRLRRAGHRVQERLADLTAIATEAFSAIRVVRAFATEEQELERFRRGNVENFDALLRAVRIQAFLSGVIEIFLICALAVVFWFGGRSVIGGALSPGELIAFIGYIAFMVQPIRTVMSRMGALQTGLAAAERIFAMLDTPTEPTDRSRTDPGRLRGEVTFEDVRFSYTEGREILKGISLSVRPGERIAVVGPTGSGKSTLVDLIPRFYDPTSGRVLIDGHDAATLLLPRLRRQIGIVPQESVLMKGSIAFNIAYGLPAPGHDPLSDPELMSAIRRAAHVADIDGFIEGLPEGYATEVGERGVTLSGGQRQRIAIARAVVRDPRILILDEATSSLDLAVERQVQEAMNRAMAGRTAFVIAHRLSTVRSADRILVLEDGRIVQEGTHDALVREGGLYARLHRLQFEDTAGERT